ncbi:MAG: stage V sporulation protein E, cell division protein FtsW [Candidatus Peregrinibacteria bacterium GW2011_GWF2_33_10]|nr:MAG: stage V sporulation protein E, cell division protein FtsW [Candidatus Peregrinibacteria bacterium GW2011_GWF2_33_10]OGJ44019.1 MAG: hypothetical protein A2263_01395 [Candidatus Peregrinibacteria bacterium RIFOXYA2_FULL_33_21]OGJ47182.1 MAG: hypothetical protein A2272_05895 [Candidatus Peregrinibacteria bacterium RIFOXYA12_FULL_33_12]OGJ49916.1 MAG: hypothetical protein A2307_00905 [Candidatus Peregrinibacteria bacterium RIFOXYB2_FULL_33_20]
MQKFLHQIDYGLLLAMIALLAFGFIMIASIGVTKSIDLSIKSHYQQTIVYKTDAAGNKVLDGNNKPIIEKDGEWITYPNCKDGNVDCYKLVKSHLVKILIGLIGFFIALTFDYRVWKKLAPILFVIVLLMILATAILGTDNGTIARNWIIIPGFGSIQPAEFAKLAIIFYFAIWMERRPQEIATFHSGFLPFAIIAGIYILPIMMQPDFGSVLVLALIAVSMYFVAGASLKHILVGSLVVLLITTILVTQVDYLNGRFKAYINPTEENCRPDPKPGDKQKDYCWQSEQANIAVGSGGILGRGLAQGIQKNEYLPQASDDFIFAASAEELGFIRIFLIVLAYFYIACRGIIIANHAPDRFAQLVAIGVVAYICFQAFVNISVNVSLLPVTGITLPFVSFGGTSLLSSLISMGVLMNISKFAMPYAYNTHWRGNGRTYIPKYSHYRRS